MDSYTLNTVNYNYKTLSHEGFGGVCKYIATPKRIGYSRLLVKHENIQSACNTFMCSRLAELCDVYTPKAYLMSTSDETRRLFPMHPFIVGTEWVEDFSAVDYGSIEESPALRQQYWGSMALYAMFCRIADTPQFAYSPAKGFAYDWDEAFDVTDFVIKLCLYNTDAGTEQLRRMLRHFSQHPFESDAELCLQSAASHLNMDADELRSSYIQVMNRFCKVTKAEPQCSKCNTARTGILHCPSRQKLCRHGNRRSGTTPRQYRRIPPLQNHCRPQSPMRTGTRRSSR